MGSGQLKNSNTIKSESDLSNIANTRFVSEAEAKKFTTQESNRLRIQPFKRLIGWQLQLQGLTLSPLNSTLLTSQVYFQQQESCNTYLGHMVALRQIYHLHIYDDFQVSTENSPFCITTRRQLAGIPKPLDRMEMKSNIDKFILLLTFLSNILEKTDNIFITPSDLVQYSSHFYLRGFLHKECSKKSLIMAYIVWLFEEYETFEQCINIDETVSSFKALPRYIKEIFYTIKNDKINDAELHHYFQSLYDKMRYLDGGFDSFHVCYRAKRQKYNAGGGKEWLIAKKSNQIYFVNVDDGHVCQGRVMRKAKKINVENTHIMFNVSEFEVNFMLEGTRNMVKTTQFELEDCFTISDIQIKHKFPFKIRNPLMFCRGREIYLLDQTIYRFSIDENKLYQQSKKINDSLCLVPSVQYNYMVIRHSIDIFRYGIKIYVCDKYETLNPSGNRDMSTLMENIKVDIKNIQFCIEVFKGIFFMLADKNLWVLDLNYMCFSSYSPLQRVHTYFKGKTQSTCGDFIFQILNQPFGMSWLSHQDGLNVHIRDDSMFVVANVTGKLFYLQYKLIFEAGLLKLVNYKPLYTTPSSISEVTTVEKLKPKESFFNVYNQSMTMYKNTSWIHKGDIFFQVKNVKMATFKNFTQIFLETEDVITTLKQAIEQNRILQRKWSKYQTTILLYKLWHMMYFLNLNNIVYKNFNLSNIWISSKRNMKLVGWSQPQRNWHISDYKDYLLSCFNIITQNNHEKLNDKFLQKNSAEMRGFPVLLEKMNLSIRNKMAEKKIQVQKSLLTIKQSLSNQIYSFISSYKSSRFIFSFEVNTPRFSMLNIEQSKIKKMVAIIQSNNNNQEEFTFKQFDEYAWSERENCLYVMTSSYQMYEIKINTDQMKEETIAIEEYQYLPKNIIDCSFISCANGLFAFGGISRNSKKKVHYNENVYHFNREKLTWESIAKLGTAKIKPKLVLSQLGGKIYVMNGDLDIGNDYLQVYVFDTGSKKVQKMIDLGIANPFSKLTQKHIFKVFQISEKYNIFLIWSVNSTSYQFKLFSSLTAGFEIDFEGKIYLEDGAELPSESMAFTEGALHFLRPYGKYSKITIEGLQNPKLINKTLYSL